MLPITMVARMFILMTEDFKRIIVVFYGLLAVVLLVVVVPMILQIIVMIRHRNRWPIMLVKGVAHKTENISV